MELLKVDIFVAIRINGSDHPVAIFDGAFHAQVVEDEVELGGGDEVVLVLIVELELVVELRGSDIFGARVAECGELGQGNEAVVVGVELVHDAAKLVLVELAQPRPPYSNALKLSGQLVAVTVVT
ncbi:hypothetical protein CMV_003768 [Castanea mollissima]|uniref:Uncharacterized protein n=1 Tax=Castanea mollissima TaxID=60419 RepID=A0A8J4VW73_9ROSI|nr:hypothetical protein CMV_003768 [Castanea mollissima]